MPCDELVRLGKFPNNFPDVYLLKFAAGDDVSQADTKAD
jgi:hypothetical protein